MLPSLDAHRTLASFRQLDGHPLYTMTYHGAYASLPHQKPAAESSQPPPEWACSLFAAGAFYGRNFDWSCHPALLLFTYPPDGLAAVTMVDLHYLGFSAQTPITLESHDHQHRLLLTPWLPFDGMNAAGFALGMAQVAPSHSIHHPHKRTVGSLQVMRLLLDKATTTDEALRLLEQYNIDFTRGPWIHYLLADRAGNAAVVEVKDGQMSVVQNEHAWHAATNFYLTGASAQEKAHDQRYCLLETALAAVHNNLSWKMVMELLERVAQAHTQWSIVYNMRTADIYLTTGRRYDRIHHYNLVAQESMEL